MAHTLVSEIIEIADDGRNDWVERNGERVVDNEAVQRSRLRVDARKWAAAKLLPKVYGDRVVTELGNATGDDGKPVPLAMEVVDKTEQALAGLRAKLHAKSRCRMLTPPRSWRFARTKAASRSTATEVVTAMFKLACADPLTFAW